MTRRRRTPQGSVPAVTASERVAEAVTSRILTKSRAMEYLTLDGLTKMTGVRPVELDVYTLKELVDNGLDASERAGVTPHVDVMIERTSDGHLVIEVADRGTGLSPAMVREITNFERFGGTKYFMKKPTRGAQGNALMTIVGLVSALWRDQGAEPPPIVFESQGHRHEVTLRLDTVLERADAVVESVKISDSADASDLAHSGTRIRLTLPRHLDGQVTAHADPQGPSQRYHRLVEEFALWNPHAAFALRLHGESLVEYRPAATGPTRYADDGYGSPHWYTLDDFERLVYANVRALEEAGERESTLDFAKRFKGCSSNRKEFTEQLRAGLPRFLNDIRDSATSERLFGALRGATKPPAATVLGEIGKAHLEQFIDRHYGLVPELFKYQRVRSELDGTDIPLVLEVAIGATKKLTERRVAFGINGTVTYRSPFEEDLYQPTRVVERDTPWQKVKGLRELLAAYRIGPQEPVMVAVHLICPNIRYGDYGKSTFDTGGVKKSSVAAPSDLAHSPLANGASDERGRAAAGGALR